MKREQRATRRGQTRMTAAAAVSPTAVVFAITKPWKEVQHPGIHVRLRPALFLICLILFYPERSSLSCTDETVSRRTARHHHAVLLAEAARGGATAVVGTARGGGRGAHHDNNNKKKSIVQVFLLAGDDNVEGYAWSPQLFDYIHNESIPLRKRERYFHLLERDDDSSSSSSVPTSNQWVERDDVFVAYQHERHHLVAGKLNMHDYGVSSGDGSSSTAIHDSTTPQSKEASSSPPPPPSYFGPEVEMGHVLGNAFPNDYVLIVKAGWSGKSLAKDFSSPSSASAHANGGIPGYYWHSMLSSLERVMTDESLVQDLIEKSSSASIGKQKWWQRHHSPSLHVQLAGVVWFQGFPDLARTEYREAYEDNLIVLLRDLQKYLKPYYARDHYYEQGETESILPDEKKEQQQHQHGGGVVGNEPYLPIILGELGMTGNHASSKELHFRKMQKRVCQMPEFKQTTLFVPTHQYVVRDQPRLDGNIHYYGRGDTMIEIGSAFATGLLKLVFQQQAFGESDKEREADYEAFEERMQLRFLLVILLSLGLAVILLAYRRGRRAGLGLEHGLEQEEGAILQRENLAWSLRRVVQFFRPTMRRKQKRRRRRRQDRTRDEYGEDDNDSSSTLSSREQPNYNVVDEGHDLGSLPGSDSALYELDEISSRGEEDEVNAEIMIVGSHSSRRVV